ncbi:MAG: hypothetical protein LC799_35765, partial [Actinobacteria bacterium]|nr:hypothetical protein [Actinomycetota bacterium]
MRIVMLWSRYPNGDSLIRSAPMLAQALLYADKVLLITAAEDDYDWMENEGTFDFIELFGGSIQVLEAGMFDFDSFPA